MSANYMFWNAYRLGKGTKKNKSEFAEAVLAQVFNDCDIYAALLCEITSGLLLGDSQIDKQLVVTKGTKKKTQSQLGYGGLNLNLKNIKMTSVKAKNFKIASHTGMYLKGGSSFKKQSKRNIGYIGTNDGLHVYVYHANASSKAAALTAWAALACYEHSKGNFLLVGDFNCEPGELKQALLWNKKSESAADEDKAALEKMASMIYWDKDSKTHNAKKETMTKVYDYAVCTRTCKVVALKAIRDFIKEKCSSTEDMSDHLPIIISV